MTIRESEDSGKTIYMAMLDAKSAFDVVVKDILMRKTCFSGVEAAARSLIDELHSSTKCYEIDDPEVIRIRYFSGSQARGTIKR